MPNRGICVSNIGGTIQGKPDGPRSQSALIALNRFGFGARGGASAIWSMRRPIRAVMSSGIEPSQRRALEMPGLASTPALAEAVFAYQAEFKQAARLPRSRPRRHPRARRAPPATDAKAPRRSLSLNSLAMENVGKGGGDQAA